jgi:hypothetical protein
VHPVERQHRRRSLMYSPCAVSSGASVCAASHVMSGRRRRRPVPPSRPRPPVRLLHCQASFSTVRRAASAARFGVKRPWHRTPSQPDPRPVAEVVCRGDQQLQRKPVLPYPGRARRFVAAPVLGRACCCRDHRLAPHKIPDPVTIGITGIHPVRTDRTRGWRARFPATKARRIRLPHGG